MKHNTTIDAPSGADTRIEAGSEYRDYIISVGTDPDNSENPLASPASSGAVQLEVVPFGFATASDLVDPVFDLSTKKPSCYRISGAYAAFIFKPSSAVDGAYRISIVA